MKTLIGLAGAAAIGAIVGGAFVTSWQVYAHVIAAACWVFTQ